MPHKYVSVDGLATLLHHRGPTTLPEAPPDTSRGEVVLCLHGRGGNGNVFAALLDALASAHAPLAFDQPGHGRSGGLDSLGDVEALADFTAALSAKLGLRPCVALGHDLGAAVALSWARAQPDRVRALVLYAAAARFPVSDAEVDGLARVAAGRDRRQFDAAGFSPATPRAVYARAFGEWLKTDPRATLGDVRALRAFSAEGWLGQVAQPALVVEGEDAPEDERARGRALADALPRATLATLPGAGRHPHLEQPEALAAAVSAFLRERAT